MIPEFESEIDLAAIRDFADALQQLVWVANESGSREYFNPAWTEFTGLTVEQSRGNGWQLALHPADLPAAVERWEQNREGGLPHGVSYRFRSSDDEYRIFSGAMFPLRDGSGRVRKWIGICDETEAASRADDRFKLLADTLPMLVWTTDRDDRLTFVNHAWYEYTGLAVGTLIEERNALVHPDDLGHLMHALRSGAEEVEFRLRRRRDGVYRWHLLRWERLHLGEENPFHRIGTAIDIHDRRVAQMERERQLRVIAEAVPDIVWSIRADGAQDYANQALARYIGADAKDGFGDAWLQYIHPDDRVGTMMRWNRSFETGEPYEHRYRLRRFDGTYRWFLARGTALRDESGQITRWFGTATDIDEEIRSNAVLSASENYYRTLVDAMPNIAWSVNGEGVQDYVNEAWRNFTGFESYDHAAFPDADRETMLVAWEQAFRSGQPFEAETRMRRHDGELRWFLSRALPLRNEDGAIERWFGTSTDIDDQKRAAIQQSYLAVLGNIVNESLTVQILAERIARSAVPMLGVRCSIVLTDGSLNTEVSGNYGVAESRVRRLDLPLVVRGERIGVMGISRDELAGPLTKNDHQFLHEVAHRTALALKNAELYQREHRVSQALQSASLPKSLPQVPWLHMDAVYVPGSSEAQIGGDWYDAFRLPDGRLVFSIGDVAGSGLDAAVTMSNMRQVIRGTAQVHADPVLMLNAADRALRIDDGDRFVTAFVAVLSPVTGIMTYASAGHVPPYIRRADGSVEELNFVDLPLGLRERHYLDAAETRIEMGDMIVFYTDGLVESTRDLEGGVRALRDSLENGDFSTAARPAAFLQEELLPEGARDDVAILTVKMLGDDLREAGLRRWRFDALDAPSLHRVRREFRETLLGRGVRSESLEFAELVLGELAGNAVRHAPGPVEIILDFSNRRPVLHVIDSGPGFERAPVLPLDLMSESGRGLYIVSQATLEFSVMRRRPSGSHARAVLL